MKENVLIFFFFYSSAISNSEGDEHSHHHSLNYNGSKKRLFQHQQEHGSTKSSSSVDSRSSIMVETSELMLPTDKILPPTNCTSSLPIHQECLTEETYEEADQYRVNMHSNETGMNIDQYRNCEDIDEPIDYLLVDQGDRFVVKKAEYFDNRNDFYGALAADKERNAVMQSPETINRKSSIDVITEKLKTTLLSGTLKSPISDQNTLAETVYITCDCDSLTKNKSLNNGKNDYGIQRNSVKEKKKGAKKNGFINKLKLKRANSSKSGNGVVTIS